MPLSKSVTLSSASNFPHAYAVENFFNKHLVTDLVEYYQFFSCPSNSGTDVSELEQINYQGKIVIWDARDALISKSKYNYYYHKNSIDFLERLEQICKSHPDKMFILFSDQFFLDKLISVNNLFCTCFHNIVKGPRYQRCQVKNFGTKPWITLNSGKEPHRIALLSYLLSNKLDQYGKIAASNEFSLLSSRFTVIDKFFRFTNLESNKLRAGFRLLKRREFNRLDIKPYNGNNIKNYNQVLLPEYETTALEIISGSLFFEPTPFYSEKEIQSVYGKNFPIYINTAGAATNFKESFGMDIFEDIVDHDYDAIEDPTERLKSAIDLNMHLLDGSTDLGSIWRKNQSRFDKNCQRMDEFLYNDQFQEHYSEQKIKSALDFFDIKYQNK
jgi:hypothetical protein